MSYFNRMILLCVIAYCSALQLSAQDLEFVQFSKSQFHLPIEIANAGDSRMFVVEQPGRVRIVQEDGTVLSTPFLDITDRVLLPSDYSQLGLLGMDFHPDYATNGRFYVYYIGEGRMTYISEFKVSDNPDLADASSEVKLLEFAQPSSSMGDDHKGGCVKFGKDGYLYVTTGDGGKKTYGENAQDLQSYLGKMIRMDVPGDGTMSFPDTNPFLGDSNGLDGIWAYGLRNPWTFSFDKENGDLYIGDVGADRWDEINYQAYGVGGINYGWPCIEGDEIWEDLPSGRNCPDISETELPVLYFFQTAPAVKVSIVGGFVYRGTKTPYFDGQYIYAEAYSNEVFHAYQQDGAWIKESFGDKDLFLTSFGQGADGELYAVSIQFPGYADEGNYLYKVQLTAPAGTPGIDMSATTATVSESGTTTKIDISLLSKPDTDVVLNLSSSDESEATVSPSKITFTSVNALQTQTITITGVDDDARDGDKSVVINVGIDDASDAAYAALDDLEIAVTCEDDETGDILPVAVESSLKVYPNPATTFVQIQSATLVKAVSLSDLSGKTYGVQLNDQQQIDVSGLPAGIYFLKVVTDASVLTKKLCIK